MAFAAVAPVAVVLVAGGDVHPFGGQKPAVDRGVQPVADRAEPAPAAKEAKEEDKGPPCCMELVPAAPVAASTGAVPGQMVSRSTWRVAAYRDIPQLLPVGVANEQGLQVKTILAARSVSKAFPEIHEIGGVRPDSLRWHPDGLALDVMIPNPSSAAGIALGNQVVSFALKNAARFGLQDVIWRGTYYTPNGPQNSGMGHFDHVHITTTGGGYPTGGEVYVR